MRTAVYNGTRKVYDQMHYAINSMLANKGADRIVVLTEDDEFPYPLTEKCRVINISSQQWIRKDSPNYCGHWTWMVMMRACLTKILPVTDIALSMDCDTIVDGDISGLWRQDLSNHYLAACMEPDKSKQDPYFQMGVVLFNLKKMREDGIDDEIIHALNTKTYGFTEQDCINEICKGRILEMDSKYNCNRFTKPTQDPRIIHYAAEWGWERKGLAQKYKDLNDVSKCHKNCGSIVVCQDGIENVAAMGGIKADTLRGEPNMKVKLGDKVFEVKEQQGDLYILGDGSVASVKDCKEVKDEKPKAEPKPKAKKKAE